MYAPHFSASHMMHVLSQQQGGSAACMQVGAGKSSLLAAILGDLQPVPQQGYVTGGVIKGSPAVCGRLAYCQQVPWIEAGTVHDNIVFGAPFDPEWCAVGTDKRCTCIT